MKSVETKEELPLEQREELLRALKARFEKNMNRHKGLDWAEVQARLEANTEKLCSLNEMERTGDGGIINFQFGQFHCDVPHVIDAGSIQEDG
jgi:Protein of unknown function (DUF4256)